MKHKHIIQLISTYETTSVPRQFGILLAPVGNEDLSHYLERVGENDFPKDDVSRLKSWPLCLPSAVSYIHSQRIRHKDIKPSNIICKGDEVLLTDFGSAHEFSAGLTSSTEGYAVGVTKMYCAPEVIAFDRRGRSADIYSLGCVFAEMFTVAGRRRIEDFHEFRGEPVLDEPDLMTHVYHATAHKLKAWFVMQDDAWSFSVVSRMMADDPKARPKAGNLNVLLCSSTSCTCYCSPNGDLGLSHPPRSPIDDGVENKPVSEFEERYGRGSKLMP
jgi:serine/threonine protein kinase